MRERVTEIKVNESGAKEKVNSKKAGWQYSTGCSVTVNKCCSFSRQEKSLLSPTAGKVKEVRTLISNNWLA